MRPRPAWPSWGTVSEALPQSLITGAAAMTASHVGCSPRLISEDEAFRIESKLAYEPFLPPFQDVGKATDCG